MPASSVETLLLEKRRHELVQPFKLALLKLASQVWSKHAGKGGGGGYPPTKSAREGLPGETAGSLLYAS